MLWFKHYTNASQGQTLQRLYGVFGKAKGYGLYFLLVEYFARKWDGHSEPLFVVNKNELSWNLGLKQKQLISLLELMKNESDLFYEQTDNELTIKFAKLALAKHRDSLPSSLRGRPKSGIEENRREENTQSVDQTSQFDLESIYQMYPRKEGKAKGMDVLKRTIKTEADYLALKKAVENYANKCRDERTEKQYIKQFSAFIGPAKTPVWRDYLEIDSLKPAKGIVVRGEEKGIVLGVK